MCIVTLLLQILPLSLNEAMKESKMIHIAKSATTPEIIEKVEDRCTSVDEISNTVGISEEQLVTFSMRNCT